MSKRPVRIYLLLALLATMLGIALWRSDLPWRLRLRIAASRPPVAFDGGALRAERLEMRLLRSIFTGTFQGVTREELVRLAETETDAASDGQNPDPMPGGLDHPVREHPRRHLGVLAEVAVVLEVVRERQDHRPGLLTPRQDLDHEIHEAGGRLGAPSGAQRSMPQELRATAM